MDKPKINEPVSLTGDAPMSNGVDHHAETEVAATAETTPPAENMREQIVTTVATVGVVGVAAIVFEAALIPGMILGVAAALAPAYVPKVGAALTPMFRSTMRGAYKLSKKTKETASEFKEQFHDIAAEVHAEGAEVATKAAKVVEAKAA